MIKHNGQATQVLYKLERCMCMDHEQISHLATLKGFNAKSRLHWGSTGLTQLD